jgi:ketosteroid isomerase-like protein
MSSTTRVLFQRAFEANSALINGDIATYVALIPHSDDFTLMAPFGGTPTHGFDTSSGHLRQLASFFQHGDGQFELVQSYASADMVVLVLIERLHCAVGGLPAQDWPLRVTLVYRRDGAEWQLVHRHADPLAKGISMELAAAIARG